MEPAGGDQILAQVLMTEAQHADQPRHQTLASARHVAGARIRTANMRTERTTQTRRVLIIGELVARDIEFVRTHATDRLRARGHQHIARHRAPYECLRECYRRASSSAACAVMKRQNPLTSWASSRITR